MKLKGKRKNEIVKFFNEHDIWWGMSFEIYSLIVKHYIEYYGVFLIKDTFENSKIANILLNKKIILNINKNCPDYVCFDESVKEKGQLYECTKDLENMSEGDVKSILEIWQDIKEKKKCKITDDITKPGKYPKIPLRTIAEEVEDWQNKDFTKIQLTENLKKQKSILSNLLIAMSYKNYNKLYIDLLKWTPFLRFRYIRNGKAEAERAYKHIFKKKNKEASEETIGNNLSVNFDMNSISNQNSAICNYGEDIKKRFEKVDKILCLIDKKISVNQETEEYTPWNVPFYQNPNFTGREEQLEQLHKMLAGNDEVVINQVKSINGMGGVGKTQLAVEYCHEYKENYPGGILWVKAEGNILEGYGLLADELGLNLPNDMSTEKRCLAIRRKLNNLGKASLIVLDNLDDKADYTMVKEYFPTTGSCRLLITSRRSDLTPQKSILLDILALDKALELLLKESDRQNENEAGERICDLLGCLPLGLELASRHLARIPISLTAYASNLEECEVLLHSSMVDKKKLEHTDHVASLRATLVVNANLLEKIEVQQVLATFTCFAPEDINQELLHLACNLEEDIIWEIIAELKDYSLVREQNNKRFNIHRLLRQVLLKQIPDELLRNVRENYVVKLQEWFAEHNEVDNLKVTTIEISHIMEAAKLALKDGIWPQSFFLCYSLAEHYYYKGQFQQMLEWSKKSKAEVKAKSPDDYEKLGSSYNFIGMALMWLGNYDQAIKYCEKALSLQKKHYGDRSLETVEAIINIGATLNFMGNYNKAIVYYQQALDINRKLCGEKNSFEGQTLSNIGESWRELGNNEKAIEFYQQALSIIRECDGEKHINVATCLNNLGMAWNGLGNHKKGKEFLEQSLLISQDIYGENHPKVANTLNNLGMAWNGLGNHEKAKEFFEQALLIGRRFYGEKHPYVATTIFNYSSLWASLGNHRKTIEFSELALLIFREVYGERHPSVARALANLSWPWCALGCYEKAYRCLQEAYSIFAECLGEDHYDTRQAKMILGPLQNELLKKGILKK